MNFKTRKINKKPKISKEKEAKNILIEKVNQPDHVHKRLSIRLGLGLSIVIIVLLFAGIAKAVSSIDFSIFLKVAGDELQKDAYEHSNFLILGTGGKNHDGGDLTDTIMLASLDDENKLVSMISIPRDFYIKDSKVGNSRINEVYLNAKKHFVSSTSGLEHLKNHVEEMMGIPIHYWVKIDFTGFKEIVDNLGGIDVNVEQAIHDPYYPKDGTYNYQTFNIGAGPQHLDGETALKYARSRKTTSDFDRAKRQQEIIYAIKEKALQTEIIFSTEKISEILDTLKRNFETNITVKEFLTLGSIAKDYSKSQITHRFIHDNPVQCGGFLYTPLREAYGGMFILLPAGGLKMVHLYADLIFNQPRIGQEKNKIHLLNGTKKGGVAGETKQILQRFCFDIVRFGNGQTQDIQKTTYYYKQKLSENGKLIDYRPESLNFLQKIIPGQESTNIPPHYLEAGYSNDADIIVELGQDYVNSENYLDDPFYSLPIIAPSKPAVPPPAENVTEAPEKSQ